MNIDKFVNDNADKIEKIIFDSQGNVKEIQLKCNTYYPWYPYVEPYREPTIIYTDTVEDTPWYMRDNDPIKWINDFNLEKQLIERTL